MEVNKEVCEYCKKEVNMHYITIKINEAECCNYVTKHEFELRQCPECKLIQNEE